MKKFLFLVLFLFVSCSPQYAEKEVVAVSTYQYDFRYVVIDNMPCIINDEFRGVAITCDWSQWNGRVVDGEIVIGD